MTVVMSRKYENVIRALYKKKNRRKRTKISFETNLKLSRRNTP